MTSDKKHTYWLLIILVVGLVFLSPRFPDKIPDPILKVFLNPYFRAFVVFISIYLIQFNIYLSIPAPGKLHIKTNNYKGRTTTAGRFKIFFKQKKPRRFFCLKLVIIKIE